MPLPRLIPCLDVAGGRVVKGVRFEGLTGAGDPASLARRYNAEGIDELVILDVTATIEHSEHFRPGRPEPTHRMAMP